MKPVVILTGLDLQWAVLSWKMFWLFSAVEINLQHPYINKLGVYYKRKIWKGKIIKNILKRRKERGSYLATDSVQMTKNYN